LNDDDDQNELARALNWMRPTPEQEARDALFGALVFAENKAKLEQIVTELVVELTGMQPDNARVEASLPALLDRIEDENLAESSFSPSFAWWPRCARLGARPVARLLAAALGRLGLDVGLSRRRRGEGGRDQVPGLGDVCAQIVSRYTLPGSR